MLYHSFIGLIRPNRPFVTALSGFRFRSIAAGSGPSTALRDLRHQQRYRALPRRRRIVGGEFYRNFTETKTLMTANKNGAIITLLELKNGFSQTSKRNRQLFRYSGK